MRRRDLRSSLEDAAEAASTIGAFVAGRSLDELKTDRLLAAGIERQFEILGEALGRALAVEPAMETALPDARRAIGMRNAIAHGYDTVEADSLWSTAVENVPGFLASINRVLSEMDSR